MPWLLYAVPKTFREETLQVIDSTRAKKTGPVLQNQMILVQRTESRWDMLVLPQKTRLKNLLSKLVGLGINFAGPRIMARAQPASFDSRVPRAPTRNKDPRQHAQTVDPGHRRLPGSRSFSKVRLVVLRPRTNPLEGVWGARRRWAPELIEMTHFYR